MYRAILLASFLFCLSFHSTAAQQPTTAQRDAIRSSCRSDFIAKCSGVEPGGKAALECLERNHDSLSASCKTAIDGLAAKPAPAPPSTETPAAEAVPPATTTPPGPSAEQASLSSCECHRFVIGVQSSSHWAISTKGGRNCSRRTRPARRTGEKTTGPCKGNDGGDARSADCRAEGSDPLGLPIRFHGALLRRPAGRQRRSAMPR
jgi:hypothetical protein